MKREYIIVLVIIAVIGVGGYLFIMNNKNTLKTEGKTTTQATSVEKVTIPTQNVKVNMPKAQSTNLDTEQLENEINNLDVEANSDLDVDIE